MSIPHSKFFKGHNFFAIGLIFTTFFAVHEACVHASTIFRENRLYSHNDFLKNR